MKNYIKQALLELEQIPTNTRHHLAPSHMVRPNYGAAIQYAHNDDGDPVDDTQVNYIERVVGKLLYYARAIDNTMLHALNDIASVMSKGTTTTAAAVQHLLDYARCNPDAEIIYRASEMILHTDSDAAYLVAPGARSRAGGYHYLGNRDHTLFNGPIHVLAKIIKNVMASAMEAEIAALYMNAQLVIEFRQTLADMGHPQPPTLVGTDNESACGILTGTM